MKTFDTAPPLEVFEWINTPRALTLADLRGRVVLLHAFQMLCPACVSHGLPQAVRIHQLFSRETVCVLGLHTVFEHHAVMGLEALKAFVHEYRLQFPIGVDQPDPNSAVPLTMQAYGLQGTPSLVLIDKAGRLRLSHFGRIDDLALGAAIGQLSEEGGPLQAGPEAATGPEGSSATTAGACTSDLCPTGASRNEGGA